MDGEEGCPHGVCRASHQPCSWVFSHQFSILLGACKVCLSFPRSRAVGRKACWGIISRSLPKHHVTFPVPAG